MKTAGELLRDKRLLKELTLEEVASRVKVKPEYLAALESSNFAALPGETPTKGFLRSYARFLRLNPDTLVAMFRRDFTSHNDGEIVPHGLLAPLSHTPRIFTWPRIAIWSTVVVFLFFLGYQLFSWWSLPRLDLIQPKDGELYGAKITVKGQTSKDNVVSIVGQKVLLSESGEFSLDLVFPPGQQSITVQVTNREGRSRSLERTFLVSE